MNKGDAFYHEDVGTIAIGGVEDAVYAGVKRTVVYATVLQIEYYWDKATGVLLEATQSTAEFTQNWKAEKTNMWQAQIFGLDPTVLYALAIVVAVVIVAIITIFIIRRKKK